MAHRILLWLCTLVVAAADQQAWPFKPAKTPAFSLEKLKVKVDHTIEKLLFRTKTNEKTIFSGVAGGNQFATVWVRDFCHATGGLLQQPSWRINHKDVPSTKIVRSTLEAILALVEDGQGDVAQIKIPRALDSLGPHEDLLTLKVLQGGANLKKKVTLPWGNSDPGEEMASFPHGKLYGYFQGEGGATETSDAGYLLVIAFSRLAKKLKSSELQELVDSSGAQLRLALEFYSSPHRWEQRNGKWFFHQSVYSEWKDSCKQEGLSSYSNLQLIQAFRDLLEAGIDLDFMKETKLFGPRFGHTDTVSFGDVLDHLPDHLADWTQDVYDHFIDCSTGLLRELDANGDRELFDVCHIDAQLQWLETGRHSDAARAKIGLNNISKAFIKWNEDGSIRTIEGINKNGWPHSEVSDAKTVIGLYQYHGTFAWSWWTCWFAEIAAKEGDLKLSEDLLDWIWRTQADSSLRSKKFFDYISEVYSGTSIVNTLGYVSETPFLWGSSYCQRAVTAVQELRSASTTWAPEATTTLETTVTMVQPNPASTEAPTLLEVSASARDINQEATGSSSKPRKSLRQKKLEGDEAMFLQEL